MRARAWALVVAFVVGVVAVPVVGCESGGGSQLDKRPPPATGAGGSMSNAASSGAVGGGFNPDGGIECEGLECNVPACSNAEGTTITGKAYAPNGTLPLYNVIVYVPKFPAMPLEPLTFGAQCEQCAATISNVMGTALTDSKGNFKLINMPAGQNIPLVVQIGKWRRKVTLPSVQKCTENALTDPELTRLPRNQTEGDIPQMSLVTGGCDVLPCLFRKMGLADNEFTDSSQPGKMHIYRGQGGATVDQGNALEPHLSLWSSVQTLTPYDIVLLACECDEYNAFKTPEQMGYMRDYLNLGGRVFGTHYHYTWLKNGPPEFQQLAEWPTTFFSTTNPYKINISFPKGIAFMEWLQEVGNISGADINLTSIREDVGTVYSGALAWIYKTGVPTPSGASVKYFTYNTPVSAMPDQQCGRGVFSDIHVSEGFVSNVPSGCDQNPLTDQEKALIFLFFDLAACITPDDEPPAPPLPE